VDVETADRLLRAQVMPTRSYLSQSELPVTFGLGRESRVRRVTVCWPDGTRQELGPLAVDQMHVVEQSAEQVELDAAARGGEVGTVSGGGGDRGPDIR
jgi:hypothetical protein